MQPRTQEPIDNPATDRRGLIEALVGDGRPLLSFVGLALVLSGAFALFLVATGNFLPHDERFLVMTADQLCALHGCRVVHFMYHDRGAFGGSLVSVGIQYLWLVAVPLSNREPWAWWTMLASGAVGFASFLTYLGYGYLDTWHGSATLVLLPCFVWGMWRTYVTLVGHRPENRLPPSQTFKPLWTSRFGVGRAFLLLTAVALVAAGIVIMVVGMTSVFVPQDLAFMGLDPADLHAINPRLVPLIAHDRAGFGGGLVATGVIVFLCVRFGRPSPSLWQALLSSGVIGFGTAIGVHPLVGYLDIVHLAPAVITATLFVVGLAMTHQRMFSTSETPRI